MKRHDIIFWLFSLCAVIVSCAKDDSVSENTDKRYEFVLSVGSQKNMRMANEVVQYGRYTLAEFSVFKCFWGKLCFIE
jgi:hypothetical protein